MDLISNKINREAWNRHAERYQRYMEFSFDVVDYGSIHCATDETLHLIGDVKGLRVLELGCGSANCGIALAKRCGCVTCVDISEEQIKYAKENAARENVDIHFIVSPMEALELAENQYDVVISMNALNYVEDTQRVFNIVYKTLRHKGIFVFSVPDATYASIIAKYLLNSPVEQHSYFYNGPEIWKWEEEDDFEFVTFRRAISGYINMLIDAGFTINRTYQLQANFPHRLPTKEFDALYPNLAVFKVSKSCNL